MIFNGKNMTVYGRFTVGGNAAGVDDTKVGTNVWSSKNTVDKLCPAFEESGAAVRCEPVEGYPLQVVSQLAPSFGGHSDITLQQLGKNIYDEDEYPLRRGHYVKQSIYKTDMCSCIEKFIPVAHLRGHKITISHVAPLNQPGLYFYTAADGNTVIQPPTQAGWKGPTFTVPDNASYMRFAVPIECADIRCVQIELGEAATAYEPYRAPEIRTVDLQNGVGYAGGFYNWSTGKLTVTHEMVWLEALTWEYNEDNGYFFADLPGAGSGAALCDIFTHAPGTYDDITTGACGEDRVFDIQDGMIAVICTDYSPAEDFEAFLADNAPVLVYPLANPTMEAPGEPQLIEALAGTNTLISSTGDTQVSGRADPVAIIDKLTNAILSLGGNV